MAQPAAAMLAAMLFLPFHYAQASTATAEKAYQKGDFATAQREYAAAAQRDLRRNPICNSTPARPLKAGQFPQAAEAFEKSLKQRTVRRSQASHRAGGRLLRPR